MAGWGMAASSAMDLFSGFLDRNAAPSKGWQRQVQLEGRQYDYDKAVEFREDARRYGETAIQRTVADAKAAGVHPLFALGGRASGSGAGMPSPPTSGGSGYIPGQHSTGSGLGTGLRAAARGIRGIAAGQPSALEVSQTELNTARSMQIASETKRAEQNALSLPGWQPGPGDMATVHPLGTRTGVPLNRRPLTSTGRKSMPEYIEVIGPGGRPLTVINPDLGLDEYAQVHYAWQKLKEYGEEKLREPGSYYRWKKAKPAYPTHWR